MVHVAEAEALLRQAMMLERAGRLTDAQAAYAALLSRWPHLADSWYNLALLQRRAGRYEAALASYQQALDRGVSQPEEVHLNRGVIFSDCLRQPAAAERELQAALALNPSYIPALLNLANLEEDLGRRDPAAALYEQIIALEPRCYEALARYANLKDIVSASDPLLDRLRSAIKQSDASVADKASLGFALGKSLDAVRAYDDAFDAYVLANRFSRQSAGAHAPSYDRQAHERFIDQLIDAFASHHRIATPSSDPPHPIFICGMFRSGSTLTEQVLAGHARVQAGGELPFIPALAANELAPFPSSIASIPQQQFDELGLSYRRMLTATAPGAQYVTDKRPDNFLYIGLIKRLFPDAKIIHTTRHPLDNCLSVFFLHLDQRMSYALDLLDTAHYYGQYRRLMAHWRALYEPDILHFDYDELVRDPGDAVHRLLAFCGLEWDERCMAFQYVRNAVRTASVWQVRQPLYQHASGRWRNYAARLAGLRSYLAEVCPDLKISD
jgi:tetratricopeptide (TPR) repeat protein